MQRRYRSVRHQPFLLPPRPVWNRHLGMRNWWAPTHTIIKEHALLNGVVQRWTFLQLKIDSAAVVSAYFYFLNPFFFFLTDSISPLCPVQSLCQDKNLNSEEKQLRMFQYMHFNERASVCRKGCEVTALHVQLQCGAKIDNISCHIFAFFSPAALQSRICLIYSKKWDKRARLYVSF